MPVCQINYKITLADTVLLEDQFVLHWPIAEEDEPSCAGVSMLWFPVHWRECRCARMMLYLPAFVLHLLSNSPGIFMLKSWEKSFLEMADRLLISLDTSSPCTKATSCKCVETFPWPFSYGKAFYLLLQVGAMHTSSVLSACVVRCHKDCRPSAAPSVTVRA